MSASPVAAVLVHVADVDAGLAWYQRAFPQARRERVDGFGFEYLAVGQVRLEVVASDDKVASGAAGSIVYWSVPQFELALDHMRDAGATLYRGPMDIENGERMCQVRDPWGNCIGLRGPSRHSAPSRVSEDQGS